MTTLFPQKAGLRRQIPLSISLDSLTQVSSTTGPSKHSRTTTAQARHSHSPRPQDRLQKPSGPRKGSMASLPLPHHHLPVPPLLLFPITPTPRLRSDTHHDQTNHHAQTLPPQYLFLLPTFLALRLPPPLAPRREAVHRQSAYFSHSRHPRPYGALGREAQRRQQPRGPRSG